MADLTTKAFASPNFAFLVQYDEVLVRHAALAERYIFDDPNAALLKLRQFGELLAQHAAACTGVAVEEHESQRELIDQRWDRQIINAQVSQLFHGLRKSGAVRVAAFPGHMANVKTTEENRQYSITVHLRSAVAKCAIIVLRGSYTVTKLVLHGS